MSNSVIFLEKKSLQQSFSGADTRVTAAVVRECTNPGVDCLLRDVIVHPGATVGVTCRPLPDAVRCTWVCYGRSVHPPRQGEVQSTVPRS